MSQLISCTERVTGAVVAQEELCQAHEEGYHTSFCDARVFRNSGLLFRTSAQSNVPIKKWLIGYLFVHTKQTFCVQLFLLTWERSLVHLSQPARLRVKCKGNSMNIRELGLKQCVQRLI